MRRGWQRVWVQYTVLFLFLAAIAGTLSLIWYRSPNRGLPYHDQFTKGELNGWHSFGGTWSVQEDRVRNDSGERGAKLITGSQFWANYQVEADLQLLGNGGDAGIVIRASDLDYGVDSYRGYYAGLRVDDQSLVLGRAEYGWLEYPPIRMPGGVSPNRWYHLTASAYECTIHASATALDTGESVSTSAFDRNCVRSGKIGLRDVQSGGIWRNVEVHGLNRAENAQLSQEKPTPTTLYPTDHGPYSGAFGVEKDMELSADSRKAPAQVVSIDSLRLLTGSRPVHVTVRGTITLIAPHTYVQDATGGAEVSFQGQTTLELGQQVEVTGDAHREGLSVRIENATKRNIAGDVPVPAFSITPLQAAIGRYDGMFVEVEGKVERASHANESWASLHLSGGQQEFTVISNNPQMATLFTKVEAGSLVRLRGVCVLGSAYTNDKVPFALIVQSPGNLEILSGPPWWSGEHLAMLAVGMLALGFLIHRLSSHAAQRRQLRNVINTIPGYVWSYMPDGQVDFVNDRWLEFTGLSLEGALGENWKSSIHPDDQPRFFADHVTARKNGQAWESEVRVQRADGEYRWWLARNVPLRNKAGNISKWYGTGVDIDDRKRAEQALRRSETYLAEAQRLSHTGSWAWILRTGELFWSQEVFRIFEIDPETNATWSQASWSRFLDSVHPEDRARIEQRAKVESTEKDWAVSEIEFRIVVPDGTTKHVHGISYRVADDVGETAEVMGTIVDVTERKRAQQEREKLLQLETDLVHMNRIGMLGELAASLAHELNQPITGAVTSARACLNWLAHDPPGIERARATAVRIEKDGTRAAEIINRLRAFYKKGAPPQREVVEVSEIVREMFVLLHDQLDPQSIKIVTLFAADVPKVMADRIQLQQVFMNLMLNAIEAMKDTGGELTIRLQSEGDHVLVSVSDTGVGLPSENTSQIFDAFYTTKSQGTGMGLAISRSIIEAHAGRLWASTNGTRGATFHFTLPADVRG
jgi:PAS domain S-box-containing protein